MHQPLTVRFVQTLEHLHRDSHQPVGIDGRLVAQQVRQRATFQKRHHEVEAAVVHLTEIDDGHGVGMLQLTREGRLAPKPLHDGRILSDVGAQDFDGEFVACMGVGSAVDRAESAEADDLLDEIPPVQGLTN